MELWIRSQDRGSIVKVDNLYISVGNYICYYVEKGKEVPNTYFRPSGELGKYKSFERAMQVLDEIQELIKPKQTITTYESEIKECINKSTFDVVMTPKIDNIQLIEPTTLIYEMPID